MNKIQFILFFLLISSCALFSQSEGQRYQLLNIRLEEYSTENPKMERDVDISMTGTLKEFAMAFSKETKINLTVRSDVSGNITANFADTKPKDVLLYLCKSYNLDLSFSGSIVSLIPIEIKKEKIPEKKLDINYNAYNKKIELNLVRDTLDDVVRDISQKTGLNIIASKSAGKEIVDGYIGSTEVLKALEQVAKRNDLIIEQEEDYWVIEKLEGATELTTATAGTNSRGSARTARGRSTKNNKSKNQKSSNFSVSSFVDSMDVRYFTFEVKDANILEVVSDISEEAKVSFFLFDDLEGETTFKVEKVTYEEVLDKVFQGTEFTYNVVDDIYLFGNRKLEGLRENKIIQLENRSVLEFAAVIPAVLTEQVQVAEFLDLNALVVSGSNVGIKELEKFIKEVDRKVPVITIELIIVDITKQWEVNTGIEAGVATEPVASGGSVYPFVDFTFSSGGVNQFLNFLSQNGVVNLGQVNPNFYASLQAIEDNGYAKVHSRPRLSTINGKEANFAIGETRYYEVQRTTLQGNQNPVTLQDRSFQSVTADFSVNIIPIVSGDGSVTLEIDFNQSDFLGQIQNDAPPAQVNRSFTSNIRVKNQEMIVLGGIESKSKSESGRGLPLLSRIPVLKWLFSSRRKSREISQLVIFVRPTIIY